LVVRGHEDDVATARGLAQSSSQRPNILFILADDLGWQSLTRTMPYLLDQSVNDIRLVG